MVKYRARSRSNAGIRGQNPSRRGWLALAIGGMESEEHLGVVVGI